ncbi:MAG TPA: septum formation initiator family protein [Deltaproteobacteria bacterium]|nr:septum formation initiator family protein [Deltaproteobacteria bacterium]
MNVGKSILLGIILFMGGLIVFGEKGLTDYFSLRGKMQALKKENSIIHQENAFLRKKIVQLQNDPRYIEGIARNDLGMVKKGDIVYRFIE